MFVNFNTFNLSLMRRFALVTFVLFSGFLLPAHAQVTTTVDCDLMGLVVNVGSDSNSVNLYHPGGYLTFPPQYNVMTWEFTDAEGNVIHEATTEDENFIQVVHNLPVTDTLFVSVLLTNDSAFHNGAPVACLIEDYLFWEVDTWPNSGEEYGTWTLGGSVGEDVSEPLGIALIDSQLDLYPQPAKDHVVLEGLPQRGRLVVMDMSGKPCISLQHTHATAILDVSDLPVGMFVLHVLDARGQILQRLKLMVAR